MGIKLEINNNFFIYKKQYHLIINEFIDFIDSFSDDSLKKPLDLLTDLKNTRDQNVYNALLEEDNFSIFYLPALTLPTFNSDEDFKCWLNNTVTELQYLTDSISKFRKAIDICFNLSYNEYKDLTINQRYALCLFSNLLPIKSYSTHTYVHTNYDTSIATYFNNTLENNYKIIKQNNEPELHTYVEFQDINSMCLFAFNKMLEQHTIVKECKNCKHLFIADNKREYCYRIQKDGTTCSQTGYSFKEKKKVDFILQSYMKAYKRLQNFCYKNKDLINDNTKKLLFSELRKTYDSAQSNTTNKEYFLKEFEKYNYDKLKKAYIDNKTKKTFYIKTYNTNDFKNIKYYKIQSHSVKDK